MKQNRTMLPIAVVIFSLLGVMVFAGGSRGEVEGTEEPELKTITVAFTNSPLTLDPFNHRHRNTQFLLRNMIDAIQTSSYDGRMINELAESITEVESGVYEIKLHKDVTFHNGDPLTADDVIFSMKRISTVGAMEGETSPRLPLTGELDFVEKINDYTLRVKYKKPLRRSTWYHTEILPQKYFQEVGLEGFLKHPIGCGPFKWVEGDLYSYVVLERNEHYWGGAKEFLEGVELERIPVLDRVIFRFVQGRIESPGNWRLGSWRFPT